MEDSPRAKPNIKKWRVIICFFVFLTVSFTFVPIAFYTPELSGDQFNHIIKVIKRIDPALFRYDFLLQAIPNQTSYNPVYYQMLTMIYRLSGDPLKTYAFFIPGVTFILQAGMFLMLFHFSRNFLLSLVMSCLSLKLLHTLTLDTFGVGLPISMHAKTFFLVFTPFLFLLLYKWREHRNIYILFFLLGLLANLHATSGFTLMEIFILSLFLFQGLNLATIKRVMIGCLASAVGILPSLPKLVGLIIQREDIQRVIPFSEYYPVLRYAFFNIFPFIRTDAEVRLLPAQLLVWGVYAVTFFYILVLSILTYKLWKYRQASQLWLKQPSVYLTLLSVQAVAAIFLTAGFYNPLVAIVFLSHLIWKAKSREIESRDIFFLCFSIAVFSQSVVGSFLFNQINRFLGSPNLSLIQIRGARYIYLLYYLYAAELILATACKLTEWKRALFPQNISISLTITVFAVLQIGGLEPKSLLAIVLLVTIIFAVLWKPRIAYLVKGSATAVGLIILIWGVLFYYIWIISPPGGNRWLSRMKNRLDSDFIARQSPQERALRDLSHWAKTTTPQDAVFCFSSLPFKVYAERATIVNRKDAVAALYSADLLMEWYKRYINFQSILNQHDTRLLSAFAHHYHADYIVTVRSFPCLSFPTVYENSYYRVYKL